MGHKEAFPPSELSARRRFRQATFVGTRGNEKDAPIRSFSEQDGLPLR
jgi:hypothetical protein